MEKSPKANKISPDKKHGEKERKKRKTRRRTLACTR